MSSDRSMDEQITMLAAEYMELVGGDHHKDCDCHWYVEKRWSYGEGPIYRAQHNGYCSEPWKHGEGPDRKTHAKAAADLLDGLQRSIANVRAWHEEEGEIPPMLLR